MSLFATFTELGDYIENIKGIKYVDNPTDWMSAFKELAGDSRYIDVVDASGEFVDTAFYDPYAWESVGEFQAPAIDGGMKSAPVVNTVVTDVATGAVVAGETAKGIEAAGMTLSISAGSLVGGIIAGLGLGVVSYEAAPEFWTDISNAIFEPITGEHLSYDETEPFLRRKLKSLLATDHQRELTTYADADLIKRAYDFIATHIFDTGYDFALDYTWVADTSYESNAKQIQKATAAQGDPITVTVDAYSLTDDMLQAVMHNTQLQATGAGYHGAEYSCTGIINDLHTQYPNYNNANLYQVHARLDIDIPTQHVYAADIVIDGYSVTTQEDKVTGTLGQYRFLTETSGSEPYTADDYGYEISLSNQHPTLLYSYQYNCLTGVSQVRDDGYAYVDNRYFGLGIISYAVSPKSYAYRSEYSNLSVADGFDDYMERNNVKKKGITPVNGQTAEERYPTWLDDNTKNKKTGQPAKDGTNKVTNNVPLTTTIKDSDTDKILNHGVNNDEDPDSYNNDQSRAQDGHDLPNDNPIDDVNRQIDDNINEYNNSDTSPDTAPDPAPEGQPLDDYPQDPPQDPSGDSGDSPAPSSMAGVEVSGMVSVYNPTKAEVISFSGWLWTDSVIENLKKILANPIDAIIGMHIMYATPVTGSSEHIICGYLDSNVSAKVVTQQYIEIDCGHVTVPEYYGSALDYEPYTQVHCYLPFVGMVALKANDVIGKDLYIKYGVDVLTGTCLAMLTTKKGSSEIMCYQFAGNCAVQIPLTGGDYAGIIRSIASMAVGVAGSVVTANPLPAIGGIVGGAMSASLDVSRSGSLGANAGAMGIRNPYLIITRRKAYEAAAYNQYYGYPANITRTIGQCKGFTRIKSVHIDNIPIATDNEKNEIETLLKQGVIIK